MVGLPKMTVRIARLPRDSRGYPVPAFVQWFKDGQPAVRGGGAEPDFRVADSRFRKRAFECSRCWICGDELGRHRVYAIGPMCVVNRVTSEPACHRVCAEFAAMACPFLTKPRMRRNAKDLPEGSGMPGTGIERNPGCVCLYETTKADAFGDGRGSWLIKLGRADRVDWWAEGRPATRAEVEASIESGLPLLEQEAAQMGAAARLELSLGLKTAMKLLPAAA